MRKQDSERTHLCVRNLAALNHFLFSASPLFAHVFWLPCNKPSWLGEFEWGPRWFQHCHFQTATPTLKSTPEEPLRWARPVGWRQLQARSQTPGSMHRLSRSSCFLNFCWSHQGGSALPEGTMSPGSGHGHTTGLAQRATLNQWAHSHGQRTGPGWLSKKPAQRAWVPTLKVPPWSKTTKSWSFPGLLPPLPSGGRKLWAWRRSCSGPEPRHPSRASVASYWPSANGDGVRRFGGYGGSALEENPEIPHRLCGIRPKPQPYAEGWPKPYQTQHGSLSRDKHVSRSRVPWTRDSQQDPLSGAIWKFSGCHGAWRDAKGP